MSLTSDFKTRFPEFNATVVDARFPVLIPTYPDYFNYPYLTDLKVNETILNLMAHLLMDDQQASQNQINLFVSTGVGKVSGQFSIPAITTGFRSYFGASKYGQKFLFRSGTRQGGIFV
jgi:hypothetical protein